MDEREEFEQFLEKLQRNAKLMNRRADAIALAATIMVFVVSFFVGVVSNIWLGVGLFLYGFLDFSAGRRYLRVMRKERELDQLMAQAAQTTVALGLGEDVFFVTVEPDADLDKLMLVAGTIPGVRTLGRVRREF